MEAGTPNLIVPYYVLLVPPASYALPDTDIPPNGPGLDLNPVKSSIYSVSSTDPASPLQRQSLWHILARTFWIPADPTASLAVNVTQAFHDAHNSVEVLRDMAPDSGADVNEPDPLEPDPITTIWGQENYDRLLRIKQKIDPNNIIPAYDV